MADLAEFNWLVGGLVFTGVTLGLATTGLADQSTMEWQDFHSHGFFYQTSMVSNELHYQDKNLIQPDTPPYILIIIVA